MNRHPTELVGALVDGELQGLRRWFVQRHVRACPPCAAEYRHVLHVRRMLAETPVRPQMTDSADFFWSKVCQEIDRKGRQATPVPQPRLALTDWLWWRRPAMATAVAALVVAAGIAWWAAGRPTVRQIAKLPDARNPATILVARPGTKTATAKGIAQVEQVSTDLPEAAVTALPGPDPDVAVIWVSGVPWTADMIEMMTHFANLDS